MSHATDDVSIGLLQRYTDCAEETYVVDAGAIADSASAGLNWRF